MMFIHESQIKAVYIHVGPVDFRKGINGLGCEVSQSFGDGVNGKNLFVFTNRKRDRIRILYWDDTGYALWHKVLEEDKFQWPIRSKEETIEVTSAQLTWLLSGLRIDAGTAHKKIEGARQFY